MDFLFTLNPVKEEEWNICAQTYAKEYADKRLAKLRGGEEGPGTFSLSSPGEENVPGPSSPSSHTLLDSDSPTAVGVGVGADADVAYDSAYDSTPPP